MIRFGEQSRCHRCGGTGSYRAGSRTISCPVCYGTGVVGLPEPAARSTDPVTSKEAAASVTPSVRRRHHELVLTAFRAYGPMTDDELLNRLHNFIQGGIAISPSGARTRRSELVKMGHVRDSHRKVELASGRRAIVWELTGEPDALNL